MIPTCCFGCGKSYIDIENKVVVFQRHFIFLIRIFETHYTTYSVPILTKFYVDWTDKMNDQNLLSLFNFNEEITDQFPEANPETPKQAPFCHMHPLPLKMQTFCLLKQSLLVLIKHSFRLEPEHWELFVKVQSLTCSKQINDKYSCIARYI